MGFARDLTPDEAAFGFQIARHIRDGMIVFARIGTGIRAIKMIGDGGAVCYEVCDDQGIVLYRAATSLFELRSRFGFGDRRAG